MGLAKLIKRLQQTVSSNEDSKATSRKHIDDVLDELDKKEKKLRKKLEKEKNPKKRKKLKLQIKILATQRDKGQAFRKKL